MTEKEKKEKELMEKLDKEFQEKLKELKKRDPFTYKNF
jgi:hypothetical protein